MQVENGVWNVEQKQLAEIPASISAVLIARLDRLAAHIRQVVQTAAVLGQEFEVRVLSQMLRDDEQLLAKVKQAEAETIWSALSEMRYLFRHALLRDAAYEMQLRARLRELHRLAGDAIEQLYSEDLAPHYADLAYHYGKAEDPQRERHYAQQAGEHAAAQFANAEAITFLSRALDLTPEADQVGQFELLLAREKVRDRQGVREAQRQDLTALEGLADQLDDDSRCAEAALRRAHYARATSNYPEASIAAQRAITLAQAVGNQADEAAGYLEWAGALWPQGNYAAAHDRARRALELSQTASLRWLEAESLRVLSSIAFHQGDYAWGRECVERAIHLCRELGDRVGESRGLANLGVALYYQGDYDGARQYTEQAIYRYREIGDRNNEANALSNLGLVVSYLAAFIQANNYLEQSLQLRREIGDRQGEAITLLNLGKIRLQCGNYTEAQSCYEQGLQLCREVGDRRNESLALADMGRIFHHLGQNETARDYCQQAVAVAQTIAARHELGRALTNLGHAMAELDHLDEAADAYQRGLRVRLELGERNLAMESLAGLVRIALAQSDLSQAQAHVEEILGYLKTGTLEGVEEPFRVYLTCYRALKVLGDARSQDILRTATELVQTQASRIGDEPLRRSFLENIACHRELVSEWRSTMAASTPPQTSETVEGGA